MMKKGISFLLTFSVLCSLLVPAALAYDGGGTEDLDQSYSAVKSGFLKFTGFRWKSWTRFRKKKYIVWM